MIDCYQKYAKFKNFRYTENTKTRTQNEQDHFNLHNNLKFFKEMFVKLMQEDSQQPSSASKIS